MQHKETARWAYYWLKDYNWTDTMAQYGNFTFNLILLLILGYLFNFLIRKILITSFGKLVRKTKTVFDDFLFKNNALTHLTHLITLLFYRSMLPYLLIDFPALRDESIILLDLASIIISIWFIRSVLRSLRDFLRTLNSFKDKPIESYLQVVMIFIWLFGGIIIFSLLTGKSVWQFLTALGALSAIILLIFKDTILGFVASIQVAVNDTVRIGDWITMEKYGADGDVIEINLSSVKIRNFDKTITSIPTYYLISDSFKNWRGMSVSGGRRIKRAVNIKTNSIRFLSSEDIADLKNIQLIAPYLDEKSKEIEQYNKQYNINKSQVVNGRNLTNIGVFRRYIELYLANHPKINHEMIAMVRQLPPTAQGTPLEVYAFSADKVWLNYEGIVSDLFDHILAALPYFKLEVYELPSGSNFEKPEKDSFIPPQNQS